MTMSGSRRITEIVIVLGLSLGVSVAYSLIGIPIRLSRPTPLGSQSATLNRSASEIEWADFAYQLVGIISGLMPVALVLFLLWQQSTPRFGALGLDATKLGRDLAGGLGLAALIGIPGLGLYFLSRSLDLNVTVIPSDLSTYWWTVGMLILLALRAGLLEEIIGVGYLFARLEQLKVPLIAIIIGQALLRASYHLYQGFGGFIGNFVMGLVFGFFYARTRRLAPLIVAHTSIDIVAFVGYPLALEYFPEILGNLS